MCLNLPGTFHKIAFTTQTFMNQYDLLPIPPEDQARFRRYVTVGLIAIASVLLFCALSCKEQQEQPSIQGAWTSVTYPANQYFFYEGVLEIHSVVLGQTIWEKWFVYEQDRNSGALEIRNQSGVYFKGSVSFNAMGDTAIMQPDSGLNILLSKW